MITGSQGGVTLLGSGDTLCEALRLGLIESGEAWMLIIQDHNLASNFANSPTANSIVLNIIRSYLPCFQ